jgi:hypothetical protein
MHGKPQDGTWTTMAALISLPISGDWKELEDNAFTMIAMTTGTRCVTGNAASVEHVILDCHAEVLLKRAFKRYLIGRILSLKRKAVEEHEKAGGDAATVPKPDLSSIFAVKYYLFVSHMPCGVAHRYHGEDEPTTNGLRRKPGKGEPSNQPSCIDKIARWIRLGLQGRRLLQVLKKPVPLHGIIVGNCSLEREFDEQYFRERLSLASELSRKWDPYSTVTNEPSKKKSKPDEEDEFWNENAHEKIDLLFNCKFIDTHLIRTPDLDACPSSMVYWREEFEKGQGSWKMGREVVTLGRRNGSNMNSYKNNPVKIANIILDNDIDTVFREMGIKKPKIEEEDLILQYEKKWKKLQASPRFKGWSSDIPSEI